MRTNAHIRLKLYYTFFCSLYFVNIYLSSAHLLLLLLRCYRHVVVVAAAAVVAEEIRRWFKNFLRCVTHHIKSFLAFAFMLKFCYGILQCWNLFITTILFENYGFNIYWRYHFNVRIKYELSITRGSENSLCIHAMRSTRFPSATKAASVAAASAALIGLPTIFTGNDFMIDKELTIWRRKYFNIHLLLLRLLNQINLAVVLCGDDNNVWWLKSAI